MLFSSSPSRFRQKFLDSDEESEADSVKDSEGDSDAGPDVIELTDDESEAEVTFKLGRGPTAGSTMAERCCTLTLFFQKSLSTLSISSAKNAQKKKKSSDDSFRKFFTDDESDDGEDAAKENVTPEHTTSRANKQAQQQQQQRQPLQLGARPKHRYACTRGQAGFFTYC